ncbi:MAG: hypothetical protein ACU0DH_13805 [Paracoccus sp. (in: a-proteobacteria)]|uniref:hypothetical protein n=1 Tax=Paracoccus sp. TaxID=267 RepID=UPI002E87FE66|nr:hypothetical protein [Pseudomonadota bacterium]
MRPQDPHSPPAEADRTSQTRFGPRPVPDGHLTDDPTARHRIPSASRGLSKDASTATKVIVWGGMALGVAGLTAAATMTARKLIGPRHPAPRIQGPVHAPRFAEMTEAERDEVRRRVRAQALEDDRESARLRVEAAEARHPRGNFAQDLTRTATELTDSLNGVAQSISDAFESFRGVSRQANSILGDFVVAADQLKAILNGSPGPQPVAPEDRRPAAEPEDPDRMHRL